MIIGDIMTTEVITVKAEDSAPQVARLLKEHQISGLPVVDEENRVIGIITEQDIIVRCQKLEIPMYFNFLQGQVFGDCTKNLQQQVEKMKCVQAKDIMKEDPTVANFDQDVKEVARMMKNKDLNMVPIVKNSKLVGVVTQKDIFKATC
ncbi:MAG: CBS domain-containing protein [Tindallia sp. MSAO_Bac2]|nr:MAG: CBS domain-containing protein [Tindallia sp. MSAO_Bac2]